MTALGDDALRSRKSYQHCSLDVNTRDTGRGKRKGVNNEGRRPRVRCILHEAKAACDFLLQYTSYRDNRTRGTLSYVTSAAKKG